ncbi:hypothetical protein COSO111634_27210 [Corallococcus soli]
MGTPVASGASASTAWKVAQTVASVGPYRLVSCPRGPAASTLRTARGSARSPPKKALRRAARAPGSSRAISWKRAVVSSAVVAPTSRSFRARCGGDRVTSRGMMISRAPLSSAPQISNVAASKDGVDTWATRSSGVRRTKFVSRTRWTMERCSTPAPFGVPVDPDV